ncbi:MAG: translation initiation factor IF-6 [Candidatus Woesearchaeota archaeon]|nr:MAG: translation initiation factor IF-6 [Candidatus Woesearchaeota archaeon]
MVHVIKLEFNSNPNVGFYGVATDKFCLLGKSVPKKHIKKIEEALKVPVVQANVYGTSLIGIFAVGNSKNLLLPKVIFKRELEEIKKKLKPLKINIDVLDSKETALSNNILVNDKVGIISPVFPKDEIKKIEECLKVKVIQTQLAHSTVPGSAGILTNKGAIFHMDLSDEEIKKVEKLLGFEIGIGSVNMGNPWVRSGVIANSKGFLVGNLSSGYEIARIDESLGFIKKI